MSTLLDVARAAAQRQTEALAERHATRRADRIHDLIDRGTRLIGELLADHASEIDLSIAYSDLADVLETWDPIDPDHGGLPSGLVGELDGIPLALLRDPDGAYALHLVACRWVDVDGARYLSTSSEIANLAQLPDALDELDARAAEDEAAIRDHLGHDVPTTGQPEPTDEELAAAETLEDALAALDEHSIRRVADVDAQLAAQVIAPSVAAIALDRIANLLETRELHS